MSWKAAAQILFVITIANVAGVLWSQSAKLWVWLCYIVGSVALIYLTSWVSNRRIRRAVLADEDEQEDHLDALNDEERILARLALDQVGSDDLWRLPVEGQVFEYERTPKSLHSITYWVCVGLSLFLLLISFISPPSDDRLALACLTLGFGAAPLLLDYVRREESQFIIVSPFGITHRKSNGGRLGILWSEVALIRNRRFLLVLEIYSSDGRRIRVGYTLKRFPEFVELLVAAMKLVEERAA